MPFRKMGAQCFAEIGGIVDQAGAGFYVNAGCGMDHGDPRFQGAGWNEFTEILA